MESQFSFKNIKQVDVKQIKEVIAKPEVKASIATTIIGTMATVAVTGTIAKVACVAATGVATYLVYDAIKTINTPQPQEPATAE